MARIPTETEFFMRMETRQFAVRSLSHAGAELPADQGRAYRQVLIQRANRQAPFDDYMLKLWSRVKGAGWQCGEKHRLVNIFGTTNDWQLAYLLAKATFEIYTMQIKRHLELAGHNGIRAWHFAQSFSGSRLTLNRLTFLYTMDEADARTERTQLALCTRLYWPRWMIRAVGEWL